MQKYIFITSAIVFLTSVHPNASAQPVCDVGTCTEYQWNSAKYGFTCPSSMGTCTCTQLGDQEQTYNCICNECSNCDNDAWSSNGTGKEKRIRRYCDCGTCRAGSTEYRCTAGYYGNGTTCTQCPSSGGVRGTSAAGTTAITGCYIPAGTSDTDTNGTFTYTGNCYYTN